MSVAMALFELLQLFLIFLDHPRIEYLWHVPIRPPINQKGISSYSPACCSRCLACCSASANGIAPSGQSSGTADFDDCFTHRAADVIDTRVHYLIGGQGKSRTSAP